MAANTSSDRVVPTSCEDTIYIYIYIHVLHVYNTGCVHQCLQNELLGFRTAHSFHSKKRGYVPPIWRLPNCDMQSVYRLHEFPDCTEH